MKTRVYSVVVHKAEERGFWTQVPALPGAGSQGETVDEALEMTKDAIQLMLEALEEDGKPIPEDVDPVETVSRVAVSA